MSNEIGPIFYTTGASLKATLFNFGAQVRDIVGAAWAAPGAVAFANCLVAVEELGATGVYYGSLPAGLSVNTDYSAVIYLAAATGFGDVANQVERGIVGPGLEDYGVAKVSDIPQGDGNISRSYTMDGAGVRVLATLTNNPQATPIGNSPQYTNEAGAAVLLFSSSLVGQTVYLWRSKPGYTYINPDQEVI